MSPLSEIQLLRFLMQIGLLLIVSRLLGELAKRFDQAPVVGELLAGIVLGRSVLGHISPAGYGLLFAVTDPAHPEQALTRTQAIMAYTAGGAYVSREENTRGKIAPGMLADLAVLSADPFTVPVRQLPGIKSELTLVGGKVVYDSGLLTKE